MYGARRRRDEKQPQQPRPPPHWFTLGSLRTFGDRLMHPPPPAPGEKYFLFVAPRYDISLEDVIEGKHLSPLSLGDFEDYLRHVERTPENLYFYIWTKRYRRMHQTWAESVLPWIPSSSAGVYRSRDLWERLAQNQSRDLQNEFGFAKSTFFDSDAPMRLSIAREMRNAVVTVGNRPGSNEPTTRLPSFPNQPEPGHFDGVLAHVEAQLRAAFSRFRKLAFCNSGLWHSCLGHALGAAILAAGLALWSCRKRAYVGASLPLLWIGVWFMLVTLNGHCLAIYLTGDARQLYPYEFTRPGAPGTIPPPVYSTARPSVGGVEDLPLPYDESGIASGALGAVAYPPQAHHQPHHKGVTDGPNGIRETFGDDESWRRRSIQLELPPARKTKDLPRRSLCVDTLLPEPHGLMPPPPSATGRRGSNSTAYHVPLWPASPALTEQNDYGIVVSEAFSEDEPHGYMHSPAWMPLPPASIESASDHAAPGSEYISHRRMTLPDIFTPTPPTTTTTKSQPALEWALKQAKQPEKGRGIWPWPRRLLGPMTPVYSPIVRRAHWAVTVRTAIVATIVPLGMSLGLI